MPRFFVMRVEEDYGDTPVASINIFRDGSDIQVEVRAKSRMIRDHLKDVLASPFYQLSPMNYLAAGISANYSLYIEPNTKLFLMYLIDRLGWYGYIINPVNKNTVTKSIYDLHYGFYAVANVAGDEIRVVTKAMSGGSGCGSASGGEMYYNKSGELVVMRVPAGCMAVSSDGRVVGPGKYLHARVNTQDSPWSLVELPKQYNTYMRTLETTENLAKKKGNDKVLEKAIERNRKMLKKLLDEGKLQYSPAYHLLTNLPKSEEVEVEKDSGTEKVYVSYVEIPEEEREEFATQLAQISENAEKLDLTPREMKIDQEPPFNPNLGSAGQVNVVDAIYYNPQLGLLATATMMPRMLQAFKNDDGTPKGVWKFALPEEYDNIINNPEAIIAEAEKKLAAGEKLSPWLAGQYHLLRNKKRGGIDAGRVDFTKMAEKYNMDIDRLRDLTIDKEFVGRINSLVPVAKVENSQYEPLEFTEEVKPSLEELENDPNEEKRVQVVNEFKSELLEPVLTVNEEGILHFKTNVSKIKGTPKSFKDIAGTASKEYWNEKKFKLNRPGLGNYQAVLAKLIAFPKMYAWLGGPKQSKGFDLNLEQGTGKTVIMLAAEAAMRSMKEFQKHFKAKVKTRSGWKEIDRFTMIVAPNAHTWANTLKGARKENAIVISGTRQERERQWEKLLQQIEEGSVTARYIVVGSGKFRSEKQTVAISEEEEAEFQVDSMDISYMKMLMTGFRSSKTNKVVSQNGLVANFVLDEAGLFVNKDANRTKLMREVRALATSNRNKGLFFTLNGEILSNSLDDVVNRLAYVNDKVFNGEDAFIGRYGERLGGKYVIVGSKMAAQLNKELKEYKGPEFEKQKQHIMQTLQQNVEKLQSEFPNSFRLNMKMISGKDLKSTTTHQTGLSGTFAKIYNDVFQKFKTIKQLASAAKDDEELKDIIQAYSLGAFSTLINASFGAANPRTLLEYGIGEPILWKKVSAKLRAKYKLDAYPDDVERKKAFEKDLQAIRSEIDKYLSVATEQPFSSSGSGLLAQFAHIFPRIPKSSKKTHINEETGEEKAFSTAYRERLWKDMVSDETRKLLNDIIYETPDPVTDAILQKAHTLLEKSANPDSDKKRLVIGSGSRILAEKVARRLEEQYGGDVEVQIITGDTPEKDRERIEQIHQQSDKPVITIVTNAGARGLNLQAPYMIRTPLWSAGQAVQMDARARRDPGKPLKVYKILSTGAASFMNMTEEQKTALAAIFDTGADIDDIEEFVERVGDKLSINTLVEILEELNVNIEV